MKLDFIDGDAKKATEECDCTDTRRGVFKACAFFFALESTISENLELSDVQHCTYTWLSQYTFD